MTEKMSLSEQAERDSVYLVYRDLGPKRSAVKLEKTLQERGVSLSRITLSVWITEGKWVKKARQHDRSLTNVSTLPRVIDTDPQFDQQDRLLRAADLALQRALTAVPVVTTAQEFKALVDAADKAIKLITFLRQNGAADPGKVESGKKAIQQVWENVIERLRDKLENERQKPVGEIIDVTPTIVVEPDMVQPRAKTSKPPDLHREATMIEQRPMTIKERLAEMRKT